MNQTSFPNIEGDSWEHLAFCTYTISEMLNDKGMEVRQITHSKAPAVTRYTVNIRLTGAKKLPKTSDLSTDLALALRAAYPVHVTVEKSRPNTLLIDVPNEKTDLLTFSDVRPLCCDTEVGSLPSLCIGVDADGWPVQYRFDYQPHLLVAGMTGSGKTSLIYTILAGLTSKLAPTDVSFLLFDEKRVEFSSLKTLPHLLYPIMNDPNEAITALQLLCEMIQARYDLLREEAVASIATYRRQAEYGNGLPPMPYIVVVIDEILSLMLTEEMRKKATSALRCIAQRGRLVGIHLIIGVQKPSPIILPHELLSSLRTRIGMRMTTTIDSRMILAGHDGAQHLRGSGDAFLLTEDTQTPIRFQAAYSLPEDILPSE